MKFCQIPQQVALATVSFAAALGLSAEADIISIQEGRGHTHQLKEFDFPISHLVTEHDTATSTAIEFQTVKLPSGYETGVLTGTPQALSSIEVKLHDGSMPEFTYVYLTADELEQVKIKGFLEHATVQADRVLSEGELSDIFGSSQIYLLLQERPSDFSRFVSSSSSSDSLWKADTLTKYPLQEDPAWPWVPTAVAALLAGAALWKVCQSIRNDKKHL